MGRRWLCFLTSLCSLPCNREREHEGFGIKCCDQAEMENHVVVQENSKDVSLSNSYEDAMNTLSSLISQKRRGDGSGSKRTNKFDLMFKYLEVLNLEECIDKLKIIHVAGTKGKGSTCTFCESILRECGFRTGLFTSPHLIDVRERYRINGSDISEEKFLQYFWSCYNQLKEKLTEELPMPRLFQFLTLLAFKIFLFEKVDVAIIEVGLGGTRDSTNVIKEPVVCGVTSLGMDHMEILGDTLEKIASQKAGIFKPRVPAFTVHQHSEAMYVLQERAAKLMIPLTVAFPLDQKRLSGVKLGLNGEHQFINAALAVSLCQCWLARTGNSKDLFTNENRKECLPESFLRGLSTASFPGRAQVVHDMLGKPKETSNDGENFTSNLIFYFDGAHTPESMEICASWFSSTVKEDNCCSTDFQDKVNYSWHGIQNGLGNSNGTTKTPKQILLFNCMEVRDPQLLLPKLMSTCAARGTYFSKALFVPSISSYSKVNSGASVVSSHVSNDLRWQSTLQRTWEKIIHGKDAILDDFKSENTEKLPSYDILYDDLAEECTPVRKHLPCSAVMPSLPVAIKWLRDCAKENPSIRLQILVTGSLHLVGDVLKLIRR